MIGVFRPYPAAGTTLKFTYPLSPSGERRILHTNSLSLFLHG